MQLQKATRSIRAFTHHSQVNLGWNFYFYLFVESSNNPLMSRDTPLRATQDERG